MGHHALQLCQVLFEDPSAEEAVEEFEVLVEGLQEQFAALFRDAAVEVAVLFGGVQQSIFGLETVL